MSFNDFIDKKGGVKSSMVEELNNSMKIEDARTLRESIFNFEFLLHNLDHKTYSSWCQDGFLIIMNQTIINNAIMAITNHALFPLRGGHRNLIHKT
jgi:hypothetical protein